MVNPDKIFGRLGNRMFQGAYLINQMREGHTSDIYVQDRKTYLSCIEKYADEIKKLYGEGIGFLDYVSIHVRRGANPINPQEPKYSENPFYVDLMKTDYYDKAIALFPHDKFLVFSDDPEFCKEKWGDNKRFKIMDKGDEIEDFNLAGSCKHHIIANSSFSWWYAFVSPYLDKRVIYPDKWFTDGINRMGFPDTWMSL